MRHIVRVVYKDIDHYLTHRKNTGVMYVNRSQLSKDIEDARIFPTKGSAKNSANHYGLNPLEYELLKIKIEVVND